MHILQEFLLDPLEGVPSDLYYRDGLSFDTYFNTFSWLKWEKYCSISNLGLKCDIDGNYDIIVTSQNNDSVKTMKQCCSNATSVLIPKENLFGYISIKIEGVGISDIKSICWTSSDVPYQRDINMAGVFCTYNRDEFLFNNVKTISDRSLDNFDLIVVDNASRIEDSELRKLSENIKLYHNPNTGGSGGFTRGLIEAIKSENNYSHILLMDDDIKIDPGVIGKTIRFFKYLNPKYLDYFISGSMMLLDEPSMLFESSASWNGFRIKNHKTGIDISKKESILTSETSQKYKNDYAAWWFCSFQITDNIKHQLPFPFFICGDDMDYSFTHAKGIINLNGIGVWHENFKNKFSPLVKSYFFARNSFILNMLHNDRFNCFKTYITFSSHFYIQLFVHDYRSAKLVLDAMRDTLAGVEHMLNVKDTDLLKSGLMSGDFKDKTNLDTTNALNIKANFNRFKSPFYFFSKKIAVSLDSTEMIELRIRSFKSIYSLLLRILSLSIIMIFKYSKASKSFRELNRDIKFWEDRFKSLREVN